MQTSNQLSKRLLGQFYTTTNPFVNEPFIKWLRAIPDIHKLELLEPFAGANNIVSLYRELDLEFDNSWKCFDIVPRDQDEPDASGFKVEKRDTLKNYPRGFSVAITNPPYLAKNSASARGLSYQGGTYDDVYKYALHVMLQHTQYVAAIIPESFITQNLFHDRLSAVISLTCRMFEDTEVPVCLALFVPSESKSSTSDFEIWAENRRLGTYERLKTKLNKFTGPKQPWKFNDPDGAIGLRAIDNQLSASIRFVKGQEIESSRISVSSRSLTRISLSGLSTRDAGRLVVAAQKLLEDRRKSTKDVFMTAFKGLRKDGKYRRRLDFAQARDILDTAYAQLFN